MDTPLKLPPGLNAQPTDAQSVKKAAQGIEAFFVRQMLKELRGSQGSEPGGLDGGLAGSTFREMLDEALADKIASAGGLGLAATFEKQLAATVEKSLPAPTATTSTSAPQLAAAPSRASAAYRSAAALRSPRGPEIPSLDEPSMAFGPRPTGFTNPLVGAIQSSGFGRRIDPIDGPSPAAKTRFHAGIDLAAPEGSPVLASQSGVVVKAERTGGYGNLVVIDHGDGTQSRYGHLSRIDAEVGQAVASGTPVGAVGHTGRATGPHLHFEVRKGGQAVDPAGLFQPVRGGREGRPDPSAEPVGHDPLETRPSPRRLDGK